MAFRLLKLFYLPNFTFFQEIGTKKNSISHNFLRDFERQLNPSLVYFITELKNN